MSSFVIHPDTPSHGDDVKSARWHRGDGDFLCKLAAWLEKASSENAFDRLVIVAAPHALGDLRKLLGRSAREKIVTEVDKDWVKLSEEDIAEHLARTLWI